MTTLRSSAIIPFCVHAPSQTVYVILAQIARARGKKYAFWGDLGGTPNEDESSESTAAREFEEESLGAVIGVDRETMERDLIAGNYFMKFQFQFDDTSHRDYYAVEVPFDPVIERRFRETREELLLLPEGVEVDSLPSYLSDKISSGSVGAEFLEKQAIRWFSLDHLMDILSNLNASPTKIRSSFEEPLNYLISELLQLVHVAT